MSKLLNCADCPNMPWEDRPENYNRPVWRYSKNPITKRGFSEKIDRVCNSSIVPFKGEFIGIFRGDDYANRGNIYVGHSKNGIDIELENEPIKLYDLNGNVAQYNSRFDPRITLIDDYYYITYCEYIIDSVTTSIARTKDFVNFTKLDDPFTPNYRNGVLFPRKINDFYKILLRPCDAGNSNFGDIYCCQSKDLEYFGKSKLVIKRGFSGWNWTKIGPGPVPIETDEGWLIFIHGVHNTCSGFIYSMGAIITDKNDPSKVLYECKDSLLIPQADYELNGYTPNVCFPTSVICDGKTGRLAIYYGAADSTISLAFTTIDIVIDYIKKHSK